MFCLVIGISEDIEGFSLHIDIQPVSDLMSLSLGGRTQAEGENGPSREA